MALGKVETIDAADPSNGTIIEDESGMSYAYNDPNFASTGLVVGSPCTYDIDYSSRIPVATNLQPYTPTTNDITTVVSGPITVNPGESLNVKKGGVVNGVITVNNGNLFVEDTGSVIGNVTINNQGSMVVKKGGVVNGVVTVNSGSALKVVNKGTVKGNIVVASANRFIVGNNNGGGIINGEITIDKIRKVTITGTSTINCGA
ncbi:hypothetical protein [Sediminibacterium sp.]|uniref:hypothetical protein n=1 Tax=Sediminibacterium sp. TaxID=1917865 RepID=UPI0027336A10|nr:hypothetical protein [Sediminibacterium sp.]MDP3567645.1 hypothetical protein [Sediminibacterium sp.]